MIYFWSVAHGRRSVLQTQPISSSIDKVQELSDELVRAFPKDLGYAVTLFWSGGEYRSRTIVEGDDLRKAVLSKEEA